MNSVKARRAASATASTSSTGTNRARLSPASDMTRIGMFMLVGANMFCDYANTITVDFDLVPFEQKL